MIKLFASDIDGTILPADEVVSPRVLQAIQDLQNNGIRFMLVSGRDYPALCNIMKKLQVCCSAIGLNGAITYHADGTCANTEPPFLSDQAADDIYEAGLQYNCYYVCHCLTGNYTNMPDPEAKKILVETFISNRGYDEEKAAAYADEYIDFARAVPFQIFESVKKAGILKVEFYYRNVAFSQIIIDRFMKLCDTASCPTPYSSIEMTHVSATKGNALEAYRRSLGLSANEIAVIGDADNDFSMFLPEVTRFAMGNAHPFLKERADYIVGDVDHSGFADAVSIVLDHLNK